MTTVQTFDDLLAIISSMAFTPTDDLKISLRNRDLMIMATAGYQQPVYFLHLGDHEDDQIWTNTCYLEVENHKENESQLFRFCRLAGTNRWIFDGDIELEGLPENRFCPEILVDLIARTFRICCREYEIPIPRIFQDDEEEKRLEEEKRRLAEEREQRELERYRRRVRQIGKQVFAEAAFMAESRMEEQERKRKREREREEQENQPKNNFFKLLRDAQIPCEGRLREHLYRLSHESMVTVQATVQEIGRDQVASWWDEYKTQAKEIDF